MRAHMLHLQGEFATQSALRLHDTLQNLEQLQKKQIEQLEKRLKSQIETVKRSRFERRSQQIGRVFDDYREWVKDTLTTEPHPGYRSWRRYATLQQCWMPMRQKRVNQQKRDKIRFYNAIKRQTEALWDS